VDERRGRSRPALTCGLTTSLAKSSGQRKTQSLKRSTKNILLNEGIRAWMAPQDQPHEQFTFPEVPVETPYNAPFGNSSLSLGGGRDLESSGLPGELVTPV